MSDGNDFSPLLRASVGFDRMMNLLDQAARYENTPSYPPYNIEKVSEDDYRITMAVAGFGEEDLDITVHENSLVIEGKKEKAEEDETATYLHRGIATRSFKRQFELADYIKIGGAKLENGLLHIDLIREVPEAKKPRSIAIESTGKPARKVIENQAA